MRKTFCDKCGKEITTDVVWVFNHELCAECSKEVDDFITRSSRPLLMDELRDFCENFSKNCTECPFYSDLVEQDDRCSLRTLPCNWSSEAETFSKLLDYKVNHPDWRKEDDNENT